LGLVLQTKKGLISGSRTGSKKQAWFRFGFLLTGTGTIDNNLPNRVSVQHC
jgi:hypothetical protein